MLNETMLLEIGHGIKDLMTDTTAVLVVQLKNYSLGALKPTLLRVPLELPLGLVGLMAARALQRTFSIKLLA